MAQVKRMKKLHSEERKEKAVILRSKRTTQKKTHKKTKKYGWIDKDLTKSPKKKCFEENRAV